MRDLEYYRSLPYRRTVELIDDESGRYYLARIVELRGVGGDGETPEAAVRDLEQAFETYVRVCLDDGLEIPEPTEPRTAAGSR